MREPRFHSEDVFIKGKYTVAIYAPSDTLPEQPEATRKEEDVPPIPSTDEP